MDRNQSKKEIEKLVQAFDSEKGKKINEAETRLRFIDPFFEALGWDIRNPREVRVESTLARLASTRPDYRFLIDGKTKYFVEAKKPAVKLTDLAPVFQAKSYGFSSKVPLVILTDFEEFRPFRTLARPKFDKPLDGLVKEFDYTYERYIDEFDNLYDTFSREAVAAGELEKRIPAEKKEASQTVDKEFLNDLSKWQEELAKNIALRNAKLTVGEINEAVQRILDRIIFLRICEDRQIEESEILLSYADKENIYQKLQREFVRLRSKYNGLIFNEHKLSERLTIDDRLLKDIIKNLYLPHSPYRFNEIPIEILGTIYEQYLGKVITLTPTHRAKVEVKPEVRKAGGVFYTPHFITSYIVKNTIGKLIEGKTPEQIAKMKFADIACGSGSFLLEMFDYLIRYHIDYYSADPSTIKTVDGVPDAFQTSDWLWHLSTRKKKEILLNNIYGVDIDPQAVEVTQMSLYLKLLEGENAETFDKQMTLELRETILPSLSNNIKCGNSLVGMDIKGLGNNLTVEEELRIRPFDWETAFPEIMRSGGFDAVVGNPPYLASYSRESVQMEKIQKKYFALSYKTVSGRINTFVMFVERGISILRPNGQLGFIVPKPFLMMTAYKKMREMLLRQTIEQVVLCGEDVFLDANVPSTILIVSKRSSPGAHTLSVYKLAHDSSIAFQRALKVSDVAHDAEFRIKAEIDEQTEAVVRKIASFGQALQTIAIVEDGINPGPFRSILVKSKKESPRDVKLIEGKDFSRYSLVNWRRLFFSWDKDLLKKLQPKHPNSIAVLGNEDRFLAKKKIVTRQTAAGIIATLETNQFYSTNSVHTTRLIDSDGPLKCEFLLGVLNSSLMNFFFAKSFKEKEGSFPQVKVNKLRQLPIRSIDLTNPDDKATHDRMVQLVERMLDLHRKKNHAKTDSEKELFEHQIKATDREIDDLVYRLYNLTDEEQKIIEQTASK